MKAAVLIGILGAAVMAAACGSVSTTGVGPSAVTGIGSAASIEDGGDAPTFRKQQTTAVILDGAEGGGTGHHNVTFDEPADPCTVFDFGLERDGPWVFDAPFNHFHQPCRYKDGV